MQSSIRAARASSPHCGPSVSATAISGRQLSARRGLRGLHRAAGISGFGSSETVAHHLVISSRAMAKLGSWRSNGVRGRAEPHLDDKRARQYRGRHIARFAPQCIGAREKDRKLFTRTLDSSAPLVAAIDHCPQHAVNEQALIFGLVEQVRCARVPFEPTIDCRWRRILGEPCFGGELNQQLE